MTFTVPAEPSQVQIFEIALQLISPVCLSAGVPAGNLTRTLDYIPGSTLRGALAACYLGTGKPVDSTFEQLFLSGEITFGNAYLNGAEPTPMSAYSCKHEAGFLADGRHGVVDWLLPRFAHDWCQSRQRVSAAPVYDSCTYSYPQKTCHTPLERFTRFYDPQHHSSVETAGLHRVITRSALDDRLQTAEQGLLYSLEVLDPSTPCASNSFKGLVVCATDEATNMVCQALLDPFFNDQATKLFVGTARSRGLGELETVGYQRHRLTDNPLADRLNAFNQQLRDWGIDDGRLYFNIVLHSDAIVQDEYFCSHATIPPNLLAWAGNLESEFAAHVRLETCYTETRKVSGWNAAMRVPKSEVIAIKMGAVFLYSIDGFNEQDLADQLAYLEGYGIGERRTEGFGRVKICDPFHLKAGKGSV